MSLQEFCLETISVTVGSSHWLVVLIDKIVPGWVMWVGAHLCAVCVALMDKFRK
jgi:hypothetical protein